LEDSIKKVSGEKEVESAETIKLEKQLEGLDKEMEEESEKWVTYVGKREAVRNRQIEANEHLKGLVDKEYAYR